jgi:dienelactone hydrolase
MRHTAICSLALLFLLAATAAAEVRTESITYADGETKLRGYFAWDDAVKGKRPAVLVIHEWWGPNDYARKRARDLAELGYLAFALDMYGGDKTTTEPAKAREWSGVIYKDPALAVRRLKLGLEQLRGHALADPARVAAIGYCFGGTMALRLAFSGAKVAGVVSFHGSLIAPAEADAIRAKILVCHGADDPMVPDAKVTAFAEAMRKTKADWQLIAYGGAVHAFTNPGADKVGIRGVAYHAAADRRSWSHMKMFFDEMFR